MYVSFLLLFMPHGVIDCCGAALLRLTAVYYAAKKRAKLLLISYLPKLFQLFSYFSSLFTLFAQMKGYNFMPKESVPKTY